MIRALEVRNFVNIAAASLELPATGFCALTGETGVGKSMLVDALALLLGGRFKQSQIREGSESAEIVAVFAPPERGEVASWLARQDLTAAAGELILRRVLHRGGRARCYINGTATTASQLETLAGMLVAICGQNEHLKLRQAERRRLLLDTAAGATRLAAAVAARHREHQQAVARLEAARARAAAAAEEVARVEADLGELDALGICAASWEENNRILDLQANAQELHELQERLAANVASLGELAAASAPDARRLAELRGASGQLGEDLASVEALVEDIARALAKLREGLGEVDQQALEDAEGFVAEATRLARKHRLLGGDQLPAHAEQLRAKLAELGAEDVAALEEGARRALASWREAAAALSAKRRARAGELAAAVQASLRQLGMAGARFRIELSPADGPTRFGAEDVEFLFAARARGALNPVGEVASGGEMSRLTLALFSLTGGDGARALVFDEVDTGISGKTAAHVGSLLAELGRRRLVLCVTHLPQVAAAASSHWRVGAADADGTASFAAISGAAREEEIARMLAGRRITAASRSNAREILDSAAA